MSTSASTARVKKKPDNGSVPSVVVKKKMGDEDSVYSSLAAEEGLSTAIASSKVTRVRTKTSLPAVNETPGSNINATTITCVCSSRLVCWAIVGSALLLIAIGVMIYLLLLRPSDPTILTLTPTSFPVSTPPPTVNPTPAQTTTTQNTPTPIAPTPNPTPSPTTAAPNTLSPIPFAPVEPGSPAPTANPTPNPTPITPATSFTRAAIINLIQTQSPSTTFEIETSPQSLALDWLINDDAHAMAELQDNSERLLQRFALATLWYSTNGPTTWFDNGHDWLNTTKSECSWDDFGCTLSGMVTWLSLSVDGLSGSLPKEIGLLTTLETLKMFQNSISGNLPSQLGRLTTLTELSLNLNSFSGNLPSELGRLTELTVLHLVSISFSGNVPSELGLLTSLTGLYLLSNNICWKRAFKSLQHWCNNRHRLWRN